MAPFASSFSPRRANRPFVRQSPSECEFRSDYGRLVRLDGQIVIQKIVSTGRTNRRTNSDDKVVWKFVRPVFTSDDLSVWDDLSVQTICSSSSVKTVIISHCLFVILVKASVSHKKIQWQKRLINPVNYLNWFGFLGPLCQYKFTI